MGEACVPGCMHVVRCRACLVRSSAAAVAAYAPTQNCPPVVLRCSEAHAYFEQGHGAGKVVLKASRV